MGRTKTIKLCACGKSISERHNKWCSECIKDLVYNVPQSLDVCITDRTRRKFLIRLRGHQCECCNNKEWLTGLIPLELDHIDGDSDNNIESNLKLLCPNCHAQTPHYKGANKGNSKRQVMRRQRYAEGKTY